MRGVRRFALGRGVLVVKANTEGRFCVEGGDFLLQVRIAVFDEGFDASDFRSVEARAFSRQLPP